MPDNEERLKQLEECTGDLEMARRVYEIFLGWEAERGAAIREKQVNGMARARSEGRPLGRPRLHDPQGFPQIVEAWSQRRLSAVDAARISGMGLSTFYRRAREIRDEEDGICLARRDAAGK